LPIDEQKPAFPKTRQQTLRVKLASRVPPILKALSVIWETISITKPDFRLRQQSNLLAFKIECGGKLHCFGIGDL
jgi:hypothetical protein